GPVQELACGPGVLLRLLLEAAEPSADVGFCGEHGVGGWGRVGPVPDRPVADRPAWVPAAGGHPGGGPGPARGRGGGARAPWSSVERGGAAPLSVTDSDFRYRSPVVGGSIAIARRSDLFTAKKNFTVLREPCGALGRGAR